MNSLILGAIAMASLVAAVFFCAFGGTLKIVIFLLFAIAFLVEALNRAALGLTNVAQDHEPCFYLVRLLAYGLIIVAIVDKNRTKGTL